MMKSNSRKVLNDFCESTSLHGYSYWYSADSLILKVAWTFVILAATCLGVVFLGNQTREYLDGRILTTIETSSARLDVSISITLPYQLFNLINFCCLILESYMAFCDSM